MDQLEAQGPLGSNSQRLFAIGGILLVASGMLFGDVFAMFVLHPNNARIGEAMFAAADYVKFVQPDVAKWGGISLVYKVASAAVARGQVFCPHYLGGALGLYASAHVLAAVGGGGYLEIDVNPNPLRTELLNKPPRIVEGQFVLPDAPGLGVEPDLARAQQWRVAAH